MTHLLVEYKKYLKTLIVHYPHKYSNDFIIKHIQTYNHLKDFLSIKFTNDVEISNVNDEFIDTFMAYLEQFNRPVDSFNTLSCLKSVCYIQFYSSTQYISASFLNQPTNVHAVNVDKTQLTLFESYSLPQ